MSGLRLSLWFLALAVGPLSSALCRVWVRQQNVSLGYRLSQAEQAGEALRTEVRKLEVARAAGRTPPQVMAMAKALGLAPPTPQQFVAFDTAAVEHVRGK